MIWRESGSGNLKLEGSMLSRIECRILKDSFSFNVESFLWNGYCSSCTQHVCFPYIQGLVNWSNELSLHYLWLLFSFDVILSQYLLCPTATLSCSEYIVSSIGSTVTYFLSVLYSCAPFRPHKSKTVQYEGFLPGSEIHIFRIVKKMTSSTNSFSLIHSWLPWFS